MVDRDDLDITVFIAIKEDVIVDSSGGWQIAVVHLGKAIVIIPQHDGDRGVIWLNRLIGISRFGDDKVGLAIPVYIANSESFAESRNNIA